MLVWPDWNTLYAQWNCLYYGVPFTDDQWKQLDAAANKAAREKLVREFREDYMKNRDLVTWELLKSAKVEVKPEPVEEEPEEIVKPAKTKKGK
jgi:hypothetical protein